MTLKTFIQNTKRKSETAWPPGHWRILTKRKILYTKVPCFPLLKRRAKKQLFALKMCRRNLSAEETRGKNLKSPAQTESFIPPKQSLKRIRRRLKANRQA